VDVVVATFGGVSILLGNGDGTLGAASPVWTVSGGGSVSVLLADVNSDSLVDLLTVDPSTDHVSVLLGDGAGGFSLHASIPVLQPAGPRSLAVADFNGDGRVDVVAIRDYVNGGLVLALGNGDGTFGTPTTFSGGGLNPFSVAAGDLNGDGIPDLAIADAFHSARGLLGKG